MTRLRKDNANDFGVSKALQSALGAGSLYLYKKYDKACEITILSLPIPGKPIGHFLPYSAY